MAAAYHVVLVKFPIALLMTATLAILLRAISDGPLAKAVDRALVPLIGLGVLTGLAAYAVGLMVWPWEAISSTPLGRNHMLVASWSLAYWTLLLVTRWLQGEAIWTGPARGVMVVLALLGGGLLTVTGTLGGHLTGVYTDVVNVLRFFGWEVYTTFYVPTFTLIVIGATAAALVMIGIWGVKRKAPGLFPTPRPARKGFESHPAE